MRVGGGGEGNSKFLNITVGGKNSNHWDRDGKERHVICARRRTDPTRAASLLQGRLLDYRAGDSLSCRLYVKQSAVLSLSLKHTNTQTHSQPFSSWSKLIWTLKNVTTASRAGNRWGSRVLIIWNASRGRFFFFTYMDWMPLIRYMMTDLVQFPQFFSYV
jgi:hypothetical protein